MWIGCSGFYCSPHIGVYGDEYTPREEFAHVTLPVLPSAVPSQLPSTLASRLDFVTTSISEQAWTMPKMFGSADVDRVAIAPGCLQLMVIVHGWARFMPCGHMSCFKTDEVNLMCVCVCVCVCAMPRAAPLFAMAALTTFCLCKNSMCVACGVWRVACGVSHAGTTVGRSQTPFSVATCL